MEPQQIRFDDGAAYEAFMGVWSRLAGDTFLGWLAPPPGLRWLDVGCGNGAFTEMLAERCAPQALCGIDPSDAQIAYARERPATRHVDYRLGGAAALPWPAGEFDAAVMALVIFFGPDPAGGVAEMRRVVRSGGSVSAYAWDILGGGFPYAALQEELAALGHSPIWPPSAEASRLDTMEALWRDAGLVDVATTRITVTRTFPDFDAWWTIAQTGPRLFPVLSGMPAADRADLQQRLRERWAVAPGHPLAYRATANAVRGTVP